MRMHKALMIGALACVGLTGCDSFLSLQQQQTIVSDQIYSNPDDFEAVIGTLWRVWFGVAQSSDPYNSEQDYPGIAMAAAANELTTPWSSTGEGTGEAWWLTVEPAVPYDNDQGGGAFLTRKLYYNTLQCIATAHDAYNFVREEGVEIGDSHNPERGDHTARARYWTKMMYGLCHLYLGLIMDQGFVVDTSIPKLADYDWKNHFVPYTEVTQYGITLLEEAIDMAEEAPLDTIWGGSTENHVTSNWLYGRDDESGLGVVVNKADPGCPGCDNLVAFMHSMLARAYAYNARTPRQRQTNCTGELQRDCTNWQKVLDEANLGVEHDFGIASSNDNQGTDSRYRRRWVSTSVARIDNMLVGPADTSGAYQQWINAPLSDRTHIMIKTPDRRIHGVGTAAAAEFKTAGAYFRPLVSTCSASAIAAGSCAEPCTTSRDCYLFSQSFSATGGTYMWSIYQGVKYGTNAWRDGTLIPTVTPKEMAFLKAEAYFRLGNKQAAADLINDAGRVAIGKLPPLTVDGPPQATPEEIHACVPRRNDGTCGDLWDALVYEKRIEMSGTAWLIMWADARGYGLINQGGWCSAPVSSRETQALGLPDYTFGGIDTPGSVGAPPAASGMTCTDT